MRRPIPLSLRLFAALACFVAVTGYLILKSVYDEIKPGVRQSTEEALVDTANLLAELLGTEVRQHSLSNERLKALLSSYAQRDPNASIWGLKKHAVDQRIYITDERGIVLFDSSGMAAGQDYSRWNDVYLTLQGKYGVRTSQDIPGDESSTVMYVAAPIKQGKDIVGVVTVAKPNRTVQPYIERSQKKLLWLGGSLMVIGLAIGATLSWWLNRALRSLTGYARLVSTGERVTLPRVPPGELQQLAHALESMRRELDGKAYIEKYVQTLTHELKSPLAAIRASVELLRGNMPTEQRDRFITNIDRESERLQQLSERLLDLAQVEQRQALQQPEPVDVSALIMELLDRFAPRFNQQQVQVTTDLPSKAIVQAERFLLQHAISNLLDNACDFTPTGGSIQVRMTQRETQWQLDITNQGDPIPDYALPRLTERFFSLPRPRTHRKSTGLGLNFVHEVAELHHGKLTISNIDQGVMATLILPSA